LEESTDLRRQVRLLEEQLAQSQDHSRQIEDEYRRMSQLRPAVDNYRDEYAHLESRHNLTISELRQAMERLRVLEIEHERLTQDKLRDQDLIASLEEAHREMELNGAALSGKSLEAGLAEAIDAEDRPALLAKVARLERELADAKAQPSSSFSASHDIEDIQRRLAAETELRMKFEQEAAALAKKLGGAEQSAESAAQAQADLQRATHDLAQAAAENTNLRSELARSEDELNKARASALASEQEANAACEALRRRDGNESADLRKETQSLEGWYAETHKQSTKFKAEVDRLSADNRQLAQDLLHLETSKREIDAENQRMRQAIERQGAKLAAASQYSQADVDRLQKELVKSREEVHSLQISIKRMKEHCLQLDQKVRQTQSGGNGNAGSQQTDYREALMSLQSQLAEKDQTLNDMRDMLRNQNNMHMLESRTMASAWFNLQRQLERQSGFGHSSGMGSAAATRQGGAPASWLGQQRVTLDMQLNG
ncbi:hypothetical protein IWW43_003465, partial [Coemansia sp. RSA 1935]